MNEKAKAAEVLITTYEEWQRILYMYQGSMQVQITYPEERAVVSMDKMSVAEWYEKRTRLLQEEAKRLEMKFYCIQYAYRMIDLFSDEEINNIEILRKLADQAIQETNDRQSERTSG